MNKISSIIQYSAFSLTTVLLMISSYLVIKKSTKEMGTYKYILLNQLFWGYIFDFIMIIWQPKSLYYFPFIVAYAYGPTKLLGPYAMIPVFVLLILSVIGMAHAIIIAFLYRISAVFYNGWLSKYFSQKISMMFFTSLIMALIFCSRKLSL